MSSYSGWYPPPSRPRAADGIKARSKRGAIGETWWSTRFIAVLEAFGMGNRLARGRNYARRGQVLELSVTPGAVTARVQGSRVKPYGVRLGLRAFDKTEWLAVADAMAADAWYAAKLLSGEMPQDVEELFAKAGLSLFPASARDLAMDCSCPDYEVPCKHIAAVFYLLAEAFDDDPFLILAWRGRGRDELLASVASKRAGASGTDSGPAMPRLDECLDAYFAGGLLALPGVAAPPGAGVVDHLPPLPLAVRGVPLAEVLRPAYVALTGDDVDAAEDEPATAVEVVTRHDYRTPLT